MDHANEMRQARLGRKRMTQNQRFNLYAAIICALWLLVGTVAYNEQCAQYNCSEATA